MSTGVKRRAKRAIERQLAYQQDKALRIAGDEAATMAWMQERSARVRSRLEALRPIASGSRVLEVGSGAHGLIFFFDAANKLGVDPLADHYRQLFPAWQDRAETVAAFGESLPFEDSSFDIVLCDNVVDHAESPRKIVEEISRVLRPGGLLYSLSMFTTQSTIGRRRSTRLGRRPECRSRSRPLRIIPSI